jgi:DNA helicase II / ATP-dependent DNA helicase PcrA
MSPTTKAKAASSLFEKEYKKLNDAQRKAVDTIEGPVMISAGPGTGKTQVVALRVANILRKTQMRPSNILCLTFSVSGAQAMRERLRGLIGADAYGVTISTIHGFCNDLIGANPLVFEKWKAMEQISDIERVRLMNKIIDQTITQTILLNKKYPYIKTREILGKISQLKREGVTSMTDLTSIANTYDTQMQEKSKEGTKAHSQNCEKAQKFRDLLNLFYLYQEELSQSGRYDYDDMINSVVEALDENDWLLQSIQERYQYVLVDEFQDLNGAQYHLIERLISYESVDHDPNILVVGDDDQAIYRFQGANIKNLLSFAERFHKAPIIPLTMSYRCRTEILDAASRLIAHNTERLVGTIKGFTKDLTAHKKESGSVQLIHTSNDMTEPATVADIVEKKLKEGIAPNEIAILTQTNSELMKYHDALRVRGIPVSMHGKLDLLDHPLVQQVITILRAIESPSSSSALAAALACECFSCHPADLGSIFSARRKNKTLLLDELLALDASGEYSASLYYHNITNIITARDVILDLHNKMDSRTAVGTLEYLLKECGFVSSQDDVSQDPMDLVPLYEFFTRMKYRAYEQPGFCFRSLLADLDLYRDPLYPDIRLSYEMPCVAECGIALMTAHQSKGLEFDTVIVPNFREGHWDKRRNPPSVSMPEDLLFGWTKDIQSFEQSQDERRIAYVAMTRAKNTLVFTCPKALSQGDRLKPVSPSGFFAEGGDIQESESDQTAIDVKSMIFGSFVRDIDTELKAFLRARLKSFSLSVTALNHFLEDPTLFLERDLLQVPQEKQSSLVYGNAVHWALKEWGVSIQKRDPLTQEGFLSAFDWYLSEREILTKAEHARLTALGHQSLPIYFAECLKGKSPIISKVEQPISARLINPTDHASKGVPLKGMIDRIDLEHPESRIATIIDYKTGKQKSEREIREGLPPGAPAGAKGGYFRQLVFYALLIKHSRSILEPKNFILDFVGEAGTKPIQRSFEVEDHDKKELESLIITVWNKINELDFSPL